MARIACQTGSPENSSSSAKLWLMEKISRGADRLRRQSDNGSERHLNCVNMALA
jgi:hypothetical protein